MEHLDWDDETVEETLAAYPDQVFYDNWEAPRHPVDLEDYPVLTTSDPPVENVVYLEDGTRVRRHRLRGEETNETCGMMINLATIAEFFDNAIHTIDDLDDDEDNDDDMDDDDSTLDHVAASSLTRWAKRKVSP